jgi:hypothetical protein
MGPGFSLIRSLLQGSEVSATGHLGGDKADLEELLPWGASRDGRNGTSVPGVGHLDFLPSRRKERQFQVLPGGAEDWNREQVVYERELAGTIGRIECEVIRRWRVSSNNSLVNSISSLLLFRRNAIALYLYNECAVHSRYRPIRIELRERQFSSVD